jgi:hypothetical protein
MVLWVSFLSGLALAITVVALIVAMARAERRTRRRLFHALGLPEETIDLLMARSGDVIAELALVRISASPAAEANDAEPGPQTPAPEPASPRPLPTIRLVHPAPGEAHVPGAARGEPHSGRHRRL